MTIEVVEISADEEIVIEVLERTSARGLYAYTSWNSNTAYPKNAVVSHEDVVWLSLRANTNVEPTTAHSDDWFAWLDFTDNFEAINTDLARKANRDADTLTGNYRAPTAPASANDTRIATTEQVQGAVALFADLTPLWVSALQDLAAEISANPDLATTIGALLSGVEKAWFNWLTYKGDEDIDPIRGSLDADGNLRITDYIHLPTGRRIIDGVNSWSENELLASVSQLALLRKPAVLRPDAWNDVTAERVDFSLNIPVVTRSRSGGVATLDIGAHTIPAGSERVLVYNSGDSSFDGYVQPSSVTGTTVSYTNAGSNVSPTADATMRVSRENKSGNGAVLTTKTVGAATHYIGVGPPHSLGNLLVVNFTAGTATFDTPSGVTITNGVQTDGATILTSHSYGGGARARDGRVVFPPQSSQIEYVLIYDPQTHTIIKNNFGLNLSGSLKWIRFVRGADDRLYGVPRNSPYVLVIEADLSSASLQDFGLNLTIESRSRSGNLATFTFPEDHYIEASTGSVDRFVTIYNCPDSSFNGFLKVTAVGESPNFITVENAGPDVGSTADTTTKVSWENKFSGGTLHASGEILMTPFGILFFGIIDTLGLPVTAELTNLGLDLDIDVAPPGGVGKFGQPCLVSNGDILAPVFDGNLWCVVNLPRRFADLHDFGMVIEAGHGQYQSVVPLPDAKVLACPLDADQVAILDVPNRTSTTTTFGESPWTMGHLWNTPMPTPDGYYWLWPLREAEFLKIGRFPIALDTDLILGPYLNHY